MQSREKNKMGKTQKTNKETKIIIGVLWFSFSNNYFNYYKKYFNALQWIYFQNYFWFFDCSAKSSIFLFA